MDFVVLDTDHDLKAPIILEHPFLHTAKATIHAGSAKTSFQIKDRVEKFSFNNSKLHSTKFLQEQPPTKKGRSKKEKNELQGMQKLKFEQGRLEFANMINTLRSNYDHLLASPFNTKKGDPGLPTIECTIGQQVFHNTFCHLGSGVNIMSKVTYDNLIGEPLLPTYTQLQMVDQTIWFLDKIAKDILVKIQDDYAPADFMILDMGINEEIPLILGRPFLNTTNTVIYVGSGQIHF